MKREKRLSVLVGSILACCLSAAAQEKGNWRAVSSTARTITGDLALADERLVINFSGFPIARVRALEPSEMSAAFDADSNAGGAGNLYRLSIPASLRFLHKNTLCGDEDTHWMVTYVTGRTLKLAFFSGQKVPVLTLDAIGSSTDLCGTFQYGR